MTRFLPLALALSACAHYDAQEYPSYVSGLGVVIFDGDNWLQPAMTDVMESDLLDVLQMPREAAEQCLLGVTVRVVDAPYWTCETREWSSPATKTCVGSTDGRWRVRIARSGRCAYDLGSRGPPYQHELTHILQRCAGRAEPDWDHVDPVWSLLDYERPCP